MSALVNESVTPDRSERPDLPYFSLRQPDVPIDILALAFDDPDLTYHLRCGELWQEVVEEMCDPEFLNRSHQSTGTYNIGCRGILCRKALREHPKRKSPHSMPVQLREERIFDPVLEYFHTVLKYRIRKAQHDLLKEINQ